MKVTTVASPHAVKQVQTNSAASADAKARAIARLQPATEAAAPPVAQAQTSPVQNPSAVAPEEMSAIVNSTKPSETTTQNLTSEAPKEETKVADPIEDTQISSRLAQLAKREKSIRLKQQQQEQAIKAKEADLAKREAELAAKPTTDLSQYISKQRLKENPLDVLAEAELSYDELTQQLINQQPKNPRYEAQLQKIAEENRQLRQAIDDIKKGQETQQTEAYQAALRQIESDATDLVNKDPAFELTRHAGEVKEIVKLIEDTYKQDGIVMSVEEAAALIEAELEERTLKFINKSEKLKNKLTPKTQVNSTKAEATTQTQVVTQKPQQTQQMKTLTNATSSTRQLTARERALLAFKGELK